MSTLTVDRRCGRLVWRSRGSLSRGKADNGKGAGGASVGMVVEGGVDVEGIAGRRRAATRTQAVWGNGQGRSHEERLEAGSNFNYLSQMTSRPSPPCLVTCTLASPHVPP